MTERWQREIKKLSTLEMPRGIEEQLERGPGPNPLPPRRQRVTAAIVAFAVFAAAGAFAFQALRNRGPATIVGGNQSPVVTIDLRAGKTAPSAALSYMDSTRQGHASSTCWEPTPPPPAVGCTIDNWSQFEAKDFVSILPGTKLVVGGDSGTARGWVESWPPSSGYSGAGLPPAIGSYDKSMLFVKDLGDLSTPVSLNLRPGIYQLVLSGTWPQGNDVFSFAIQISPEATVDLRAATAGPTASLMFDGSTWQGYGGSTCWQQGPGVAGCIDVVGPSFTQKDVVSIPGKTELTLEGDARSVSGNVLGGRLIILSGGSSPPPPLDLSSLHTVRELGDLKSPVLLDLQPGYYVLAITGGWPQGDREFYFEIQIDVPPPSVSPVLGCPFASQLPVTASTAVGAGPKDVLRSWVGYRPGDRFKPAGGVPNSWWVERSGVLIAWLRLAPPPVMTPGGLAIVDGQMCSGSG